MKQDRAQQIAEQAAQGDDSEERLVTISAADVQPENVRWLWRDWIAFGALTILAGHAGTSKTTFLLDLVGAITTGDDAPDGSHRMKTGRVLFISAEDSNETTVVPRLMAAGANRRRVEIIQHTEKAGKKSPWGVDCVEALENFLRREEEQGRRYCAVIIDPLTAFYSLNYDSGRNAEIRMMMSPLQDLARRWDFALIGIDHFKKDASVANILHMIGGSVGLPAAARSVLMIAIDPEDEDRRLLMCAKQNLGRRPDYALPYSVQPATVKGPDGDSIHTSSIRWHHELLEGVSPEDIILSHRERGGKLTDAMSFLRDVLEEGEPCTQKEIERMAKLRGLSMKTVRRAKKELQIMSRKEPGSDGGWVWEWPPRSPSISARKRVAVAAE